MGFFDVIGSLMGVGQTPQTQDYEGKQFADLKNFGANPYSSSLQDMIGNMKWASPVSATNVNALESTYKPTDAYKENSYKAKDVNQIALPQFDAMKNRLNSQYAQVQSQSQDALDRQFAAAGGGPGNGAQAKQTENLEANIARQKGEDLAGINAQEADARMNLQQQEAQKEFQSQEAQKGYGFQAGQADIGRQFAAGEAAAGRGQAAQEFNAAQGLQAQQFNVGQQNLQNQFNFGAQASIANLNTAWDQAQAEANNNEYNKAMSDYNAVHSGGLLGGGGFLGIGFGTPYKG